MTTNLPKYVHDFLSTKFTADEMAHIDAEWSMYADIRFSEASNALLLKTAKMVLSFRE